MLVNFLLRHLKIPELIQAVKLPKWSNAIGQGWSKRWPKKSFNSAWNSRVDVHPVLWPYATGPPLREGKIKAKNISGKWC